MLETGPFNVQYLGRDGEFDLLKIYYDVIDDSGTHLFKKGAILRIRPDDLWKIANKCEFPQHILEVEK